MPQKQRSSLAGVWRIKVAGIGAVAVLLGLWFLYDAAIGYPNRGERYAERMEFEYLREAGRGGSLRADDVSVPNPAQTLETLSRERAEGRSLSDVRLTRLDWLSALRIINQLDESVTVYESGDSERDPQTRFAKLEERWSGEGTPSPLTSYDVPVQWALFYVCTLVGLALFARVAWVARRPYWWEPDEKRLTLPDGSTLTPGDIEDVDKAKWHKFKVQVKVRPEHERHGGKWIMLDLYTTKQLEGWFLDMERTAFPEQAAEDAEAAPTDESAGSEAAHAHARPGAEPPADETTETDQTRES